MCSIEKKNSKEEITHLLKEFLGGDQSAFFKLVEQHFCDIIRRIARRYKYFFPNLSFEELIEEGISGLYVAIKKWGKDKDFSKYALYYIKRSMKNYAVENLSLVKIPSYFLRSFRKIVSFINKEEYSIQEIAKKTKMDVEKIKELVIKQPKKEISLDEYLNKEDKEDVLYDIIPDNLSKSPYECLLSQENKDYINFLLSKLTTEEQKVIKLRFSLEEKKRYTIKNIAEKLNISPQKVKEIEFSALMKLKNIILSSENEEK